MRILSIGFVLALAALGLGVLASPAVASSHECPVFVGRQFPFVDYAAVLEAQVAAGAPHERASAPAASLGSARVTLVYAAVLPGRFAFAERPEPSASTSEETLRLDHDALQGLAQILKNAGALERSDSFRVAASWLVPRPGGIAMNRDHNFVLRAHTTGRPLGGLLNDPALAPELKAHLVALYEARMRTLRTALLDSAQNLLARRYTVWISELQSRRDRSGLPTVGGQIGSNGAGFSIGSGAVIVDPYTLEMTIQSAFP